MALVGRAEDAEHAAGDADVAEAAMWPVPVAHRAMVRARGAQLRMFITRPSPVRTVTLLLWSSTLSLCKLLLRQ